MMQEDKQLLLKDLCSRLPYGVIVKYKSREKEGNVKITCGNIGYVTELGNGWWKECKPYLRLLSSMTEKERQEIEILIKENRPSPYGIINNKGIDNLLFSVSATSGILIDWLNKHYFDYHITYDEEERKWKSMIAKGLAIKVTKENNPYDNY